MKASSIPRANDRFGERVALSADGDTLVVSAPGEDSNATGISGNQFDAVHDSGAVYVFARSGGVWSQQAIKASNTGPGDGFGWSVGLSADGNLLAVGARAKATTPRASTAIRRTTSPRSRRDLQLLARSGGLWAQQAYIKASSSAAGGDHFGVSLGLSADGNTPWPWERTARRAAPPAWQRTRQTTPSRAPARSTCSRRPAVRGRNWATSRHPTRAQASSAIGPLGRRRRSPWAPPGRRASPPA
ncbi:MAG: hypothetical protein R3B70_12070 [Polyangiaceae bacterium]